MENKKQKLHNPVTNAKDQVKSQAHQMMPQDFHNLPTNNKLAIDPEILRTTLHSKNSWNDPDPYNLNSPEVCAGLAFPWSEEYLNKYNLV